MRGCVYFCDNPVSEIMMMWNKMLECCGEMHHYPKFHQDTISRVVDLYVTHLTNRSVTHGGCLLICSSLPLFDFFGVFLWIGCQSFISSSSVIGSHCGRQKMVIFQGWNIRA